MNTWIVDPTDEWLEQHRQHLPEAQPDAKRCPLTLMQDSQCFLTAEHVGTTPHAVWINRSPSDTQADTADR